MKSRFFLLQAGALSLILCLLAMVMQATLVRGDDDEENKILAGYFEEWSIYGANYNIANLQQNHVADHVTHLIYAFGNIAPNATCQLADTWADYQTPYLPSVNGTAYAGPLYGNFAALQQLKGLHPNLKVMISLGGASAANAAGFSNAASTQALREQLVASCIDLFINGNVASGISAAGVFDGIDIDWEFPSAADKHNFTLLLKEFRKQLDALGEVNHTHYLLSIFAPAGSSNYTNIELKGASRPLDFLNVQGYDMHGTWETVTNHAAPLFDSPKDPSFGQGFDDDDTIAAYLAGGVPARKLLLGIPFYGYGWTGVPSTNHGLYQTSTGPAPSPSGDVLQTAGVATYGTLAALTGFNHYFDPISQAPWAYDPASGTFWTYDTPHSVRVKMDYIRHRARGGLGGAFFWAFKDDDSNGTLATTMSSGLKD